MDGEIERNNCNEQHCAQTSNKSYLAHDCVTNSNFESCLERLFFLYKFLGEQEAELMGSRGSAYSVNLLLIFSLANFWQINFQLWQVDSLIILQSSLDLIHVRIANLFHNGSYCAALLKQY
jgi:hypothetical protein